MELIKNISDVYTHYVRQLNIKKQMIQKAIDASYNMLALDDFIRATGFQLPDIMELNSIRQFRADIPVLITKQLIESFGYSGEFRNQKVALLKLINAHNFPYIQLSNEEYDQFREADINDSELKNMYPALINPNGKSTHILMMSKDLKKLMMVVNTSRGNIIRENYLRIEHLLKLYLEYQCCFYNKSYIEALEKIKQMPHNIECRRKDSIQVLNECVQNKYRVGLVYFICEEDNTSIVKIGYTFNLKDRLAELQIAHYKTLIVLKYYFVQFPKQEEARLHALYSPVHVRGEWYRIAAIDP